MNNSYISVSKLIEELKHKGIIDDNTDCLRVVFDDWDRVESKFGSFVNVKVLALITEKYDGMTRVRPVDYKKVCEIGGINLWLNVGKRFLNNFKYWSSTKKMLKAIDILLKDKREFVGKDGTMYTCYDMIEHILVDPKEKELKRLQKLRAEGEKEHINNLCCKCNVETYDEADDDDIYLA